VPHATSTALSRLIEERQQSVHITNRPALTHCYSTQQHVFTETGTVCHQRANWQRSPHL